MAKTSPKYQTALNLINAKNLDIPLYENKTQLYRALNKAGFYWNTDAWQATPSPDAVKKEEHAPPPIIENTPKGIWVFGEKPHKIANFGLKLLFRIGDSKDRIIWQFAVLQKGQPDTYIILGHDDFSSLQRFHGALLKNGLVFKGSNHDLNLLKETLMPNAETAERIERLGYHASSGMYVWANGALNHTFIPPDEFGIVRHEQNTLYIPYTNTLHLAQFEAQARFVWVDGKATINSAATLLKHTFGRDALIPLCFTLAALFRDIAYQATGSFPLLCLHGRKPNTGKSSLARCLTAMIGKEQAVISLRVSNSLKSIPRKLDQFVNALIWLDELPETLNDVVSGILQAGYEGVGYLRANKDEENNTTAISAQSAIVLTGNYLPHDEILLSRWLVQPMTKDTRTDQEIAAYRKLMTLSSHGASSIATQALRSSERIRKAWKETFSATLTKLRAIAHTRHEKINERLVQNMAVTLTPALILEAAGVCCLTQRFEIDDLIAFGFDFVKRQMPMLTGQSPLKTFFEILQNGREAGKLRVDCDYLITQGKRTEKRYLAIRMASAYAFYLKEFRLMYNKIGMTRPELDGLMDAHPAFLERGAVKFVDPHQHPSKSGKKVAVKNTPKFDFDLIADEFGESW